MARRCFTSKTSSGTATSSRPGSKRSHGKSKRQMARRILGALSVWDDTQPLVDDEVETFNGRTELAEMRYMINEYRRAFPNKPLKCTAGRGRIGRRRRVGRGGGGERGCGERGWGETPNPAGGHRGGRRATELSLVIGEAARRLWAVVLQAWTDFVVTREGFFCVR